MRFTAHQRWTIYAIAAAATAWAIFFDAPSPDATPVAEPTRKQPIPTISTRIGQEPRTFVSAADIQAQRAHGVTAGRSDPFADDGRPVAMAKAQVEAKVADEAASAAATAAAAATTVELAAAPPPFRYVGRWQEDGLTVIYLQQNERIFPIRGPGVLNESYAVELITGGEMILNYLPQGQRQTLALTVAAPRTASAPPDSGVSQSGGVATGEPAQQEEN